MVAWPAFHRLRTELMRRAADLLPVEYPAGKFVGAMSQQGSILSGFGSRRAASEGDRRVSSSDGRAWAIPLVARINLIASAGRAAASRMVSSHCGERFLWDVLGRRQFGCGFQDRDRAVGMATTCASIVAEEIKPGFVSAVVTEGTRLEQGRVPRERANLRRMPKPRSPADRLMPQREDGPDELDTQLN